MIGQWKPIALQNVSVGCFVALWESSRSSPWIGTKEKGSLWPELSFHLSCFSTKDHMWQAAWTQQREAGRHLDVTGMDYNTPSRKRFSVTTGRLKLVKVWELSSDKWNVINYDNFFWAATCLVPFPLFTLDYHWGQVRSCWSHPNCPGSMSTSAAQDTALRWPAVKCGAKWTKPLRRQSGNNLQPGECDLCLLKWHFRKRYDNLEC